MCGKMKSLIFLVLALVPTALGYWNTDNGSYHVASNATNETARNQSNWTQNSYTTVEPNWAQRLHSQRCFSEVECGVNTFCDASHHCQCRLGYLAAEYGCMQYYCRESSECRQLIAPNTQCVRGSCECYPSYTVYNQTRGCQPVEYLYEVRSRSVVLPIILVVGVLVLTSLLISICCCIKHAANKRAPSVSTDEKAQKPLNEDDANEKDEDEESKGSSNNEKSDVSLNGYVPLPLTQDVGTAFNVPSLPPQPVYPVISGQFGGGYSLPAPPQQPPIYYPGIVLPHALYAPHQQQEQPFPGLAYPYQYPAVPYQPIQAQSSFLPPPPAYFAPPQAPQQVQQQHQRAPAIDLNGSQQQPPEVSLVDEPIASAPVHEETIDEPIPSAPLHENPLNGDEEQSHEP